MQDQSAPFFEGKRKETLIASSHRRRFETYLDKVFDFSSQAEALPDGRIYPWHRGKKIFDAVFLGAACQFPALHRVETACRPGGVLSKRIGPLSEDALGYALERYDAHAVLRLGCAVAHQVKRNGVLHSKWSRGLVVVAAVDGIEICSSFGRFCENCMERKVTRVVEGESREEIQYYHRICAVSVVSSGFPIPLGIRFQKNGQDEVSCSLALLRELAEQLGKRFLDVLVADALYLQTPFVKAIEALGWDWVIHLKENQPELLAESERVISTLAAETMNDHPELQLWHAPEIYWPVANRAVRVVKTIRQQPVKRLRVRRNDEGEKRAVKETVVEVGTNSYASNLELGSVPPVFIHQLARSRWIIDATVFQTMTREAHLKRPSVHQGCAKALVVLTMIRVLTYTLTLVFFHRQVRSHFRKCSLGFCDLAQELAYGFLIPQADTS